MDQRIIADNIRHAAAVVCSWPHPYRHLKELFPEASAKVFLIPLPVLNPGSPISRSVPHDGEIRLFYPGAVTPHKNHEVVIRALPARPKVRLVCTGVEVASHGLYLRKLAEQLGVSDRIEWHGYVTARELEDEYGKAHMLVMPSRWEAASGPIFEAIVRELPFIASDIGPISAQLQALDISVPTFRHDDVDAVVAALDDVLGSYDHYCAQLAVPAELLRARSWRDTSREYLEVFNWVSGAGRQPIHLQDRQLT